MIYVISKSTFGSYNVRDIQCNANWDCCPYSDYALIPDNLVEGILATKGYCDITLNSAGNEVTGFTARSIPSVPEECCGTNTVLSVNGVRANTSGEVSLTPDNVGAAPAGYGLGENIGNVAPSSDNGQYDANEITTSGWWRAKTNCPTASWWSILNIAHSDAYATQYAFAYLEVSGEDSGTVLKRFKYKGSWYPWEYVNPPMTPDVEYRTAERWKGRPVYTQLVEYGSLPAVTYKEKQFTTDYVTNVVDFVAICTTQGIYRNIEEVTGVTDFQIKRFASYSNITITTNADLSSYTAYIILKYTKN